MDRAQLGALADEVRAFLIESVSKTGGHLSSNLGTIEVTIALHKVFDSPKDQIVWDVGHQCYTHKLLTGRRPGFAALRQLEMCIRDRELGAEVPVSVAGQAGEEG